tara:strand:- start:725 stop:892 length:168 start_codon:yes stop_codon:yes gene_type:complete
MSQQMMTKEHLKNKHLADMNDLQEEEDTIMQKEIPALQQDSNVLQNEFLVAEHRL